MTKDQKTLEGPGTMDDVAQQLFNQQEDAARDDVAEAAAPAEEAPTKGELDAVEGAVNIHIKYEFDFSSQLAQKGMDPFTPHIEVDLFYTAPTAVNTASLPADDGGTMGMELRKAAPGATPSADLMVAGETANRIGITKLNELINAWQFARDRKKNESTDDVPF